ncbi:Mimitin, mitochondrial [Trichoplax sp. H2]|nr:Mimitin, mitochondrial [Trichoplax sp. H2]|eukprot:RDD43650.1 Mimitin, mitochondrial [Trichoplax sp. H2]
MSWLRRLFSKSRQLVGTDLSGNQYFEITAGTDKRIKRIVETGGRECDYVPGSIPVEWEAWLRGKRVEPPTVEELIEREQRAQLLAKRVIALEEKEAQMLQKPEEELPTSSRARYVGHASAPMYDKADSEDQASTGKDFQPASWKPK